MTPSDLSLLLVLGSADSGPATVAEIVAIARYIAPTDWQPTGDVIRLAVDRAHQEGLLAPGEPTVAGLATWEPTASGRLQICRLLRKPCPPTHGGFTRACMSAKVCLLNYLPQPERRGQVQALAHLFQEAIRSLKRLDASSPFVAGPALQDARGELLRLESELAWLEGATAWEAMPRAAE